MKRVIVITQKDIDRLPSQYQTVEILRIIDALLDNHTAIEQLCGVEFVRGPDLPVTTPTVETAETVTQEESGDMLPKPASLCAPEKGVECYNPFGLDIRALGWTGSKWTFVACAEWSESLSQSGKTIIAAPEWTRNGIRYVCAGHREPKSSGPLIENLSGAYKTTMRWYYWPTREGPQ